MKHIESRTEFAMAIARESGDILSRHFGTQQKVTFKGAIDLVTETDLLSESLLIERIRQRYPGDAILSEESPATGDETGWRWIIDPLDGTTNYAHGFPFFCVSIACEVNNSIILGVVFDPLRNELFVAEQGGGAFLNGNSIRVSGTGTLSNGLLATGFPYDIRTNPDNNLHHFNSMALQARAIRRAGSAALDLAYLAAGRFDGFWELRLQPWDTAAGTLLVSEAGGRVSDGSGRDHTHTSLSIVASNGMIHNELLTVLARST